MYKIYRVVYFCIYFFVTVTFSLSQESLDYSSFVAAGGSTSDFPTHYPYGTLGPYTAYDKIWVFYSDGEYAVWKTKEIQDGGEWELGGNVFTVTQGRYFNVAFDGEYFHFIRAVDGDLKYLRGEAHPDGSITFDAEVIAYSDPVWKIRTTEGVVIPRHFSIQTDSENQVWVAVKVGDGNQSTSNFKPIALSSVAVDGTWESRPGFPFDLAPAYTIRGNGRGLNIIEIAPDEILYTWSNDRATSDHPEQGMRARLWSDGDFGSMEDTGLPNSSAATSLVVPEDGIAMVNSETMVSRRSTDGVWTRVDPGDMNAWTYNSMSAFENRVRLWDYHNGYIRYTETEDHGETWSPVSEKWPGSDINSFSASHKGGSHGEHHSILWSEGTNPYDVVMGIEGEYALQIPPAPLLVTPPDGSSGVSKNLTLIWEDSEIADGYNLHISTDSDFSSLIVNYSGLNDHSYDIKGLNSLTTYYWRVGAANSIGESEWSSVWKFTTYDMTFAERFKLEQNFPNPFNLSTTIRFTIVEDATVRLEIYNILGRMINILIDDVRYEPGTYEAIWNAGNVEGDEVSSGIYLYRLTADHRISTKKMLFTK